MFIPAPNLDRLLASFRTYTTAHISNEVFEAAVAEHDVHCAELLRALEGMEVADPATWEVLNALVEEQELMMVILAFRAMLDRKRGGAIDVIT